MCYFSHKDILVQAYFYRKVIQGCKHVSDLESADCIIPCTETSLDSITYKINSEWFTLTLAFIAWPQTSLHPDLLLQVLYMPAKFQCLAHALCCSHYGFTLRRNYTWIPRCSESHSPMVLPDSRRFSSQVPVTFSNSEPWVNLGCRFSFKNLFQPKMYFTDLATFLQIFPSLLEE